MKNHLGVNQARLPLTEFFCSKAISLQITGTSIGEKDVRILQEMVKSRPIFFGTIECCGAHSYLRIPSISVDLGIVGSPDVENIGPMVSKTPADARSSNNMPHSESANPIQRILCVGLESYWLTLSEFFQCNQRHFGKTFCVLQFFAKLLIRTHHADNDSGFLRSRLQLLSSPLHNGIVYRLGAVTAAQKVERARMKPGIDVESHHVPSIARRPEEWQIKEWIISIRTLGRRTSIYRFPFPFLKAAKAPQSFADVDRSVLSFPCPRSPKSC